jgi:hypothetical protein
MIDHLRALCERRLLRYVELDNVVSLHLMAKQFHAIELKGSLVGEFSLDLKSFLFFFFFIVDYTFKWMLRNYGKLGAENGGEEVPEDVQKELQRYLKL